MPSGTGTYGSSVGRPKKEKREGMMKGMMPGMKKKKDEMRMSYMYGSRVNAADGKKMNNNNKPHNDMDRMKMNIGGAMNVSKPV